MGGANLAQYLEKERSWEPTARCSAQTRTPKCPLHVRRRSAKQPSPGSLAAGGGCRDGGHRAERWGDTTEGGQDVRFSSRLHLCCVTFMTQRDVLPRSAGVGAANCPEGPRPRAPEAAACKRGQGLEPRDRAAPGPAAPARPPGAFAGFPTCKQPTRGVGGVAICSAALTGGV